MFIIDDGPLEPRDPFTGHYECGCREVRDKIGDVPGLCPKHGSAMTSLMVESVMPSPLRRRPSFVMRSE